MSKTVDAGEVARQAAARAAGATPAASTPASPTPVASSQAPASAPAAAQSAPAEAESVEEVARRRARAYSEQFMLMRRSRCFAGGEGGWWQYEWCHARSVKQVHRNQDGTILEVLLGEWDEAYHIAEYARRRPDRDGRTLTQYFRNGQHCPEAGKAREVRSWGWLQSCQPLTPNACGTG
jgi:hypothetical protein